MEYFKSKKSSESGFKRPFKWYITFVSVLYTMRSVFKKLDPYQTDIEAAERPLVLTNFEKYFKILPIGIFQICKQF